MTLEYAVKWDGKNSDAVIILGGVGVATLRRGENLQFSLDTTTKSWVLDPRVNGEIWPFSMSVTAAGSSSGPVLTIRNHVFFHGMKAYMLTAIPEEVHPAEHTLGKRHITRLDKFPFARFEDIDLQTWGALRRNRGVSVGTVDEPGRDEFRVTLTEELQDIGLQLSAACYLLYTSN
jgi:hypothetical protein